MRRFVVTTRLKRGSFHRVREILREGPPFDLAGTSFERHQIHLGSDELVLFFEGQHADEEARRLLDDFGALDRLAQHFKGSPGALEEIFAWERPAEMDGVSFDALPGPGDSDGG